MDIVIMPDMDAAAGARDALQRIGHSRTLRYGSGRPWIIGNWENAEIHDVATPTCRLVLLGYVELRGSDLEAAVRSVRSFSDTDSLYERVAGSYITIVANSVATRVHGTLAGTHKIFFTTIGGTTVAGNKAAVLGRLSGARIRTSILSTILLAPRAPWPLSSEPLWEHVQQVPTTDALTISADSQGSVTQRWWYPAQREPLTEIAPRLNAALHASVRARAMVAPVLSSDLSGGLDSTTLAFFADEHAHRLITVRQDARDATNDDAQWAEVARRRMRTRNHIQVAPDDAPPWYTQWRSNADDDLSSPYPALRTLALNRALAHRLREHGSTLHLTGLGGDELFSTSFTHLHALLRRNPLHALRPIRGMQAIARWKTFPTVRALIQPVPHAAWLRAMARSLDQPIGAGPQQYWEPEARSPSWATGKAIDESAQLINEAADSVGAIPSHVSAVDFEMLQLVNADGHLIRRMSQVAEKFGVAFDAPYLDDAIVDLAFRVRLEDRTAHGVFKPVLQAAVPTNFPTELLARRSKGDYSAEAYAGLAENRASMLDEFKRCSILHDEGLIDAGLFCDFLTAVHPSTQPLRFLDATLGAEMWLRSARNVQGG